MSILLPAAAIDLINVEAPDGHLATIGPDGGPHVTIAWFDARADALVMATLFDQRKLRNMRHDPRVTVSFVGPGTNGVGMHEQLVVDGLAEVTEGGAPELLALLAQRYVGPGTTFPPMPDPPQGFLTTVTPTRIRGIGPWVA